MTNSTRKTIGYKAVLAIAAISLCLIFSVWQSSVNNNLHKQIIAQNEHIVALKDQKMSVTAQIAKQTSPDYLIAQAVLKGFEFDQISSMSSSNVASNI